MGLLTFISSMKDGKPPMDINVIKPDMKLPHAPRAKMAVWLVPISKNMVPTQIDKAA